MIICSFNARGLGSRVKRRKLRELVQVEKLDFLAIQESKMEAVPEIFVQRIWGSTDCDYVYLPAVGNSGGIISIWNKVKAKLVFTFMDVCFAGVCLDIVDEQRRCFIVNVYAKCNINAKHTLWENLLMSKAGFGEGLWCVLGDFNAVRDSHERIGVRSGVDSGRSSEMVAFDLFLASLELVDMPLCGRRFTWYHLNGVSMSRLDRILISPSWFEVWGNPNLWGLDRDVADHCPIVLRYDSENWGPKSFRFNNFWLSHKEFKEVVTKAWEDQHFEGWMGFILKERLKGLKGMIKDWHRVTYGVADEKKKHLTKAIMELDTKSETQGLVEEEVIEIKKLFEELWKILKSIDAMIFQRSRSKWLKEGDTNSRYFHSCIKTRNRRNKVVALRTPSGWVEGPIQVREAVVSYFRNHFDSIGWHRPTLEGIEFPMLSQTRVEGLTAIFTMEEIKEAVQESDGS
jgi:exonuclease III